MTQREQYAMNSMEPDICKFLIDQGADVDFFEADRIDENYLSVLESPRNSMNVLLISLACPHSKQDAITISKMIPTI